MNKEREALKLALEAMERYQVKRQDFDRFADEITAIKEALAQPMDHITGWDNGLSQDYDKKLGAWFSEQPNAKQELREALAQPEQGLFVGMVAKHTGLAEELAQPEQDVDYWIKQHTEVRQAEFELRRELEALKAKQEPVEYQMRTRPTWEVTAWSEWKKCSRESAEDYAKALKLHDWEYEIRKLYIAPPKREWVDLTDDAIAEIHTASAGKNVGVATGLTEAKLKEKNND